MKKEKELKDLRKFILNCIKEVHNNTLSIKKANEIAKLSVIVCQTYYLEENYNALQIPKK